ncbi:MAG: serine protease [Neomegalonema sp.]|nr:serine protease [Neomegalonema sp.]
MSGRYDHDDAEAGEGRALRDRLVRIFAPVILAGVLFAAALLATEQPSGQQGERKEPAARERVAPIADVKTKPKSGLARAQFSCRAPETGAPRASIAGGKDSSSKEFPFIVELAIGDIACGGALIAPGIVITAAHCVMPPPRDPACRPAGIGRCQLASPKSIRATTPDIKGQAKGPSARATHVIAHPDFSYAPGPKGEPALDADIAIIRLDRPLQAIDGRFAAVASRAFDESFASGGACARVAGWGRTDVLDGFNRMISAGKTTDILQSLNLEIVEQAICKKKYGRLITGSMLCAGDGVEGFNTCKGDSGGPLIVDVGGPVLVGVVSWAIGCAQEEHYTVFTRVGAPKIRGWLESVLRGPKKPEAK